MAERDWPEDDFSRAPPLRRFSNALLLGATRALWGLRVSGVERLPPRGPLLVCANHVSNWDGPLLSLAVSRARFMRALAKVELFRVPIMGWFLRRTGAIPLDRRGDVRAMRAAIDLLRAGGCLAVFPEGTRRRAGQPLRAKAGAGFLAAASGAAVVPARIVNTDRFLRFQPFEVRFGKPTSFVGDPADRAACQRFAQDVLERVFTL